MDKVLTISPEPIRKKMIQENEKIGSIASIEMDDIMRSAKVTMENASVITQELAQFTFDMNNGKGTISRLMTDEN
jgi:phospholipid/cholesterol/gamma-HCH transport system substrate-binding protein